MCKPFFHYFSLFSYIPGTEPVNFQWAVTQKVGPWPPLFLHFCDQYSNMYLLQKKNQKSKLDLFLQASCKKKLPLPLKKVLKKVWVSVCEHVFYQMQQKEAEIVSVFVWSKLKAFVCHNLKALCIRQEIKPLIKAFHRGITLHSIWTYDKVRGLLIIKLCPPDSEQNAHQAKMTTEISTQNLYNPKFYNVLSHVKVSWRLFF